MKLKPTRGNLIVKLLKEKEKTEGGILLPDTVKSRHNRAEVLVLGDTPVSPEGVAIPGLREARVGDIVILRPGELIGVEIDMGGEKCLIITDRDILAIEAK